uniref:Uncharacterized protein n=1 Tax=Globisporangium ultimum (strain ATCC 200006 / CBS 805.95 / DAOM BR144) TaxID=431595 RepID=K3WWF8_GLOUD
MYKIQLTLQLNDRPHPCGKILKEFLRNRKRETNQLKRDAFIDRGIGTVLDTCDADEMRKLSCYFLLTGERPGLQDRLDFLLAKQPGFSSSQTCF